MANQKIDLPSIAADEHDRGSFPSTINRNKDLQAQDFRQIKKTRWLFNPNPGYFSWAFLPTKYPLQARMLPT